MTRKRTMLPLLFVAALLTVALAAPAAKAAHWTYAPDSPGEYVPLKETKEVAFEGSVTPFMRPNNGYECDDVSGIMTFTPGDQAEISSIAYDECTSVSFGPVSVEPVGLPWSLGIVESGDPYNPSYIYTDEVVETVKVQGGYTIWSELSSEWSLVPEDPEAIGGLFIDGYNVGASTAYEGELTVDTTEGWIGIGY